jgi:hypothetical protein
MKTLTLERCRRTGMLGAVNTSAAFFLPPYLQRKIPEAIGTAEKARLDEWFGNRIAGNVPSQT